MKNEGYGKDYAYDHNEEEAFSGQNYFPEKMERQQFYQPTGFGFEKTLSERLAHWDKLRKEKQK